MAWERRAAGGVYYTRSKRVNGRVVREYVGTGLAGELAEAEDRLARFERADRRERLRETEHELEELARIAGGFDKMVEATVREALTAAGYHRPGRGRWRKKR